MVVYDIMGREASAIETKLDSSHFPRGGAEPRRATQGHTGSTGLGLEAERSNGKAFVGLSLLRVSTARARQGREAA